MGFGWGLFCGLFCGGIFFLALGAWVYRRVVALQEQTRQARRLAELGTLTGGLAHEIKNPLSTVQLNLQLLAEDLPAENAGRLVNRLGTVQREVSRLRDILDDFLRYAGKLELNRKPVDLNNLLQELVDFFAPQAQLQRVRLRVQPAQSPVNIAADSRLLKQAVMNLMLNGLQAMDGQGGDMILSAADQGREAVIHVTDTGKGISAENLPHIFDAYYSTRKGGTGLGLAMARRIIEEHRGRLSVTSQPGQGTEFVIHLPA